MCKALKTVNILYLAISLAILFNASTALAYFQSADSYSEADLHQYRYIDDQFTSRYLSVVDNDWDNNKNVKLKKLITYSANNINAIDKIDLRFSTKKKLKRHFISIEDSVADMVYANLKLKKIMEEYRQFQDRSNEIINQLTAVTWNDFDAYEFDNKGAKRGVDRRLELASEYRQIMNEITNSPSFSNHGRDIAIGKVAGMKGASPLSLSNGQPSHTSRNMKPPLGRSNHLSGYARGGNQSNKDPASGMQNNGYDAREQNISKKSWLGEFLVIIIRYFAENKIETAIYMGILILVASVMIPTRPS